MDADALGGSAADASADVPLARFELRVDNVRHLFGLLSAIYNGRKDSFALIKVNHKGLRVSVENASKSMCGTSLLKTDLFTQFDLALARGGATEIRFKANVAHLLECLAIYGKDALPLTSLFMSYDEADGKLRLLLEESGVTTECVLATADFGSGIGDGEAGGDVDYEDAFNAHPLACKAIIRSEVLHDAVRELAEQPGASTLQLTMSNAEPFFQLHTYNNSGGCTIQIRAASDAFVSFDAPQPRTHHYHLQLFEACLRAMASADQTYIRLNGAGMCSMVHKVLTDAGSSMLVNFTIMPDEEEPLMRDQQEEGGEEEGEGEGAEEGAYQDEDGGAPADGDGALEQQQDDGGGEGGEYYGDGDGDAAAAGGEHGDADDAIGGGGDEDGDDGGRSKRRRKQTDRPPAEDDGGGGGGAGDDDGYGDIDQYR